MPYLIRAKGKTRMKKFFKVHGFAAVFSLALVLFTLYALLDTFVISRGFAKVKDNDSIVKINEKQEISPVFDRGVPDEPEITESTYYDGNIALEITEYDVNDTAVYVADVAVREPKYLRSAFADNEYGKNISEKTSMISVVHRSVIAVNGDFYGARNSGYVIRNGTLYRDASSGTDDLVIWNDGSLEIVNERDVTAEELVERGAWQVLSFGPALVIDDEVVVGENEEVRESLAKNPRTAIAQIGYCHYLFVVSDGRTRESPGLSLYELATFIKSLGADVAYNLDGGGSSSMVFRGRVINKPTSNGREIEEREVSDIVYAGPPPKG